VNKEPKRTSFNTMMGLLKKRRGSEAKSKEQGAKGNGLRAKSKEQRVRDSMFCAPCPMLYALCSMLLLYPLLAAELLTPVLADYDHWPISYQYSGAIDSHVPIIPEGVTLITLKVSVTASGTVTVTSPTDKTQVLNISDIDADGFSAVFIMDEIGEYEIEETYTLTMEVKGLGTTESFERPDSPDPQRYLNSMPSMVLFRMNDMRIDNYSSQIVVAPSDAVKIDNVTPSSCEPGDTVFMDIIALRNIANGERIIDSITLRADWHKTSSLTSAEDGVAPVITHIPVDFIQAGSSITAEVTDNLKVDSVTLYFKEARGSSFRQIEMTPTGQPNTYGGHIPIDTIAGYGQYYLKAEDVAGNETVNPPPPQIYYVSVESVTLGDVNDDGEPTDGDATWVLENAVGLRSFTLLQRVLGDVSGNDGSDPISSYDAALILQYSEGLRDTFPAEDGGSVPSGTVEVSVPDSIGQPGASVTVPVDISNSTGLDIIGIDITLAYDSRILTAEEVMTQDTITSGWDKIAYNINNDDGEISIGMANPTKLAGQGAFVKVNFSVPGTASGGQGSLLILSDVSLNEGAVSADKTNGLFEVVDRIELVLYPGWNLISTCFEIEDNQLLSVLAPIEGLWTAVWTYDANPGWKRHIYCGTDNNLNYIVPGKGYLIYMDTDSEAKLPITGNQISNTTISLSQGWNLIGPKSVVSQFPEEALSSYNSIWTCDRGTWLKHIVGVLGFLNNFDQLEPGRGYWVYVK
jgi:hypothetical protein